MLVRIQLKHGGALCPRVGWWRRAALACSSLLGPTSLMVATLAAWQLAVAFDWADAFSGSSNPLLRWQNLAAAAAVLESLALALGWFGRSFR